MKALTESLVTVVMAPRERFSATEQALRSVLDDRSVPFEMIVVDGGFPASLRRRVREMVGNAPVRIIHRDYYLTPNEARNMALAAATTRYVAFIDNDLVVRSGWLKALVECAEETGADIVSPIVCAGTPPGANVHIAGGYVRFLEKDGKRVMRDTHLHAGERLGAIRNQLKRTETELAEFHCMLVRRSVFDRLGPLDEDLKATSEHVDLCLQVRKAGGTMYLEPTSVVTYVPPPPLALSDISFYMLRWSDEWFIASERKIAQTWGVEFSESTLLDWTPMHRRAAYPKITNALQRVLGWNRSRALMSKIEKAIADRAEARRPQGRSVQSSGEGSKRLADA